MADPEPGITDESGAALAFVDGGAAVESCKDPCGGGCEPETPCCICADPDAAPGLPCAISYEVLGKGVPPLCNPVRTCCCGSRVRITWKRAAVYDTKHLKKGNGNFQSVHTTVTETYVFEARVVRLEDGTCRTDFTPISYDYESHDVRNNHYNGEDHLTNTDDEDHDKDHGDDAFGVLITPSQCCRPEPGWMACYGGVPPLIVIYNDGPEVTWCQLFVKFGCKGKVKRSFGTTEWEATAGCRGYRAELKSEYHYEDAYDKVDESASGEATMSLEVLEDECCPPGGGSPFNPAPPLIPVEGRDPENPGRPSGQWTVDSGQPGQKCLRCGEAMRGDKCLWCGWCVSCGG